MKLTCATEKEYRFATLDNLRTGKTILRRLSELAGFYRNKIIGSPAYMKSDEQLRADAIETYERCFYPQGIGRHFSAILGSGSLTRYDAAITAPTVVIHGRADKLMRPSGGRAIADTIPGARLVLFEGMGHDLPKPLWDDIIRELDVTFAQFADAR